MSFTLSSFFDKSEILVVPYVVQRCLRSSIRVTVAYFVIYLRVFLCIFVNIAHYLVSQGNVDYVEGLSLCVSFLLCTYFLSV